MRRKLFLGVVLAAFTLSCGAPKGPGEAPPLAPRPDPVEPVPGALDPTASKPDAALTTLRDVPTPEYGASGEFGAAPSDHDAIEMQKVKQAPDAGLGGGDAAAPLPPVPDALPTDASQSLPAPKQK